MSEPLQQKANFSGAETKIFRKWFPNLARGFSLDLPRRSMSSGTSGPLYRQMQNLRIHQGILRKRSSQKEISLLPAEYPMVIDNHGNSLDTQYLGQTPAAMKDTIKSLVVLTDRELWIYNKKQSYTAVEPDRWVNMTPVYDTGTVSVSAGSPIVTGSGVDWETALGSPPGKFHRVLPGHMFNVDSDLQDPPIPIASLDSDNQLTLERNWTGSNVSNKAYTVRRTLLNGFRIERYARHDYRHVFIEEHNGDLYIAGENVMSNVHGAFRIEDYEDTGVDQDDLTYLCQSIGVLQGVEVPQGPGMNFFRGMKILNDGRMVLAIHQRRNPLGSFVTNRLLFSSHQDMTVWNNAPGGFLDLVSIPGELSAMGTWGSSLTLHTEQKIAFAHLTGDFDAPLEIEAATNTHVGCGAVMTLKTVPGGEMFVAHDYQTYLFDGNRCIPVGDDIKAEVEALTNLDDQRAFHARVDSHRNEYQLFTPININYGETDRRTIRYNLDLGSGEWTRDVFAGHVTASTDVLLTPIHEDTPPTRSIEGECFIGRPTFDMDVSGSQTQGEMVYRLVENSNVDDYVPMTEDDTTTREVFVQLDEQDFDYPGVTKTIARVQIWVELDVGSDAIAQELTVKISRDGGAHWDRSITNMVTLTDASPTAIVDFIFAGDDPISGEAYTIRVQGAGVDDMGYRLLHMMVHGQALYQVEAQV